jgi:hypothetical protein
MRAAMTGKAGHSVLGSGWFWSHLFDLRRGQ